MSDVVFLARQALHNSPYRSLRNVRCEYSRGVLTLYGRLHSFYLKQLAQELTNAITEIVAVENRIEVGDSRSDEETLSDAESA